MSEEHVEHTIVAGPEEVSGAAEAAGEAVERQAEAAENIAERNAEAAERIAEGEHEVEHHRIDAAAAATSEADEWRMGMEARVRGLEEGMTSGMAALAQQMVEIRAALERPAAETAEAIQPPEPGSEVTTSRQEGRQGDRPRSRLSERHGLEWIG